MSEVMNVGVMNVVQSSFAMITIEMGYFDNNGKGNFEMVLRHRA